ncbi:MAG TPA: DUF533 domain-containing protein [Acidobacteriota bacterium]|nr:DUF533 domain-containing protein [Acidobacteriota bacterium]
MQNSDSAPIIAIAMLASRADGTMDSAEQRAVDAVAARIGNPDVTSLAEQVAAGQLRAAELASRLSDAEARRVAYKGALTIVNADGSANESERAFLEELRVALGLSSAEVAEATRTAGALAEAHVSGVQTGKPPAGPVDEFILQQAILTGALEILPDGLANIAILPLQLRMVYQIGQRHGQKLDFDQIKDLAATFGLGAAAQSLESVAMKLIGGLAGGLLGGMLGGGTRIATGAIITFAATYALGHVSDQYYAQGRRLSVADLKALFARFQDDAKTIYPRVEEQVHRQASTLNLQSLLAGLRP